MSSYISKGSAQNKAIVITANQTQKWNWSNIENTKSDFFHKLICFDSPQLLTGIQIQCVYLKTIQA